MKSTIKMLRCNDGANINTKTTNLFKYNRTLLNNELNIYSTKVLNFITIISHAQIRSEYL